MSNIKDIAMEIDDDCTGDLEAEDEENKLAKRANWHSLFEFTSKKDLKLSFVAVTFSVAAGIVAPALAVFLGKIFNLFTSFGADQISGADLLEQVSTYSIILTGLGSASGLLHASYFSLWLVFGEVQAKNVRRRLFDGMLEKDVSWYDMRMDGIDTLVSRLQKQEKLHQILQTRANMQYRHVRELQLATSQPLGFVVHDSVTAFVALGLAFYYCWSLTLVTLSTVPILSVALAWNSARIQTSIEMHAEELTKASSIANDAFSAIDTIKCFNGQDFERWQYRKAIKRASKYYLRVAQASALQIGGLRLVTLCMFVQGFWYGSHIVNTREKNPGDILTAFWACLMATQAFEQVQPELVVLEKGRVAGAKLKSTLREIDDGLEVSSMNGRTVPLCCTGDVEIRNVCRKRLYWKFIE